MADTCRNYLAAELLSDNNIVTYRSLSRAQKVNVNSAKEILYEFYHSQNAKKPGTLRATYLVSGVQKPVPDIVVDGSSRMDEDIQAAQDLSFTSSPVPNQDPAERGLVTTTIILVRENDLERALETFEKIETKHIYSLQPHSLNDLQVLSNVNREIYAKYGQEDQLQTQSPYGTIRNSYAKRRTGQRPPPGTALSTSAPASAAEARKETTKSISAKPTSQKESKPVASKSESKRTAPESTSAPPPSKPKRESSSLFQAFAKTKPKVKRENTDGSVALSADLSVPEDETMKDASEDEQEDFLLPPMKTRTGGTRPKKDIAAERAAEAKRKEELKEMMDVDDEPEETKSPDEEQEVRDEENEMAVDPPAPTPEVTHGEVNDVTKEEATWESFSEDEKPPPPPPEPTKETRKPATPAATGKAGKKGTTGGGSQKQGGIASFFKRK
ncbi:MAG: hypothetical protein M1823_001928 [Watsoniomyces obsoletus]|nr:MAG: hypothetical protein M1823_001928 [Watsoniomyces obsoletus]